MAGHLSILADGSRIFLDYADASGSAVVNGRTWRWDFHEYCGPLWLRADGSERKCQHPTNPAVWEAFDEWLKRWEASR